MIDLTTVSLCSYIEIHDGIRVATNMRHTARHNNESKIGAKHCAQSNMLSLSKFLT